MDILSLNQSIIFIIFFIPGFVSIKVYDLLIANEPRDFSKSVLEVVTYSSINLALLSWLIWLISRGDFYIRHPLCFGVLCFIILFVFPVIWPLVYVRLLEWPSLRKHIIHPIKRPWDWFFSQNKSVWVIIRLTDGTKIGGVFSEQSYISSFPLAEQVYLEQVWKLDDDDHFLKAVENTKGVIVLGKDISSVEFFEM